MNLFPKKIPAHIVLILLFVLSVIARLPNLNRPLSKHHEFNTAVILICIESWKQGGGASAFNFVPLLNYQHPGDKVPNDINTDSKGNMVYLSFGPGWYVIPYLFFELFSVPVSPLSLQVLNLVFNFISLILLYRLLKFLSVSSGIRSDKPALAGCGIFLFQPAVLWFLGNGYVNTGIMLPFVIIATHLTVFMILNPSQIRFQQLIALFATGIILIYIDWFGVFLFAAIGFTALLFLKRNYKFWWLSITSWLSLLAGTGLILYQFVSYIGWEKLKQYWTERFLFRGFANESTLTFNSLRSYFEFLLTGFLPVITALLIILVLMLIRKSSLRLSIAFRLSVLILLPTCLVYTLVFFNWSSAHDFAHLAYSIPFTILLTWLLHRLDNKMHFALITGFILLFGVAQYYFINQPGKKSRTGMAYDEYRKIGERINKMASPQQKIFANTGYYIYSYYAKRSISRAGSLEQSLQFCKEMNVKHAIWIDIKESIDKIDIVHTEEIKSTHSGTGNR